MTIWRQNKVRKSPSIGIEGFDDLSSDPFEAHDEVDFSAGLSANDSRGVNADITPRLIQRGMRSFAVYAALAVGVGALGFTVAKVRPWTYFSSQELVYAYFEVRAVDQAGRPIAGAVVKNAGKKVGTTDSFGEWRRYMRVPLGATVPITLAKSISGEVLYATKNFAVPPAKPEKSDLDLRASVQLLSVGVDQKVADAAAVTPDIKRSSEGSKDAIDKAATANARKDDTLVATSEVTAEPTQAIDSTQGAESSSEAWPASYQSSHESVWFEAMGSSASAVSREVLPALVQRSKELGLKVDPGSDWRIRLTGLVDKPSVVGADGGGLILISSFDKGQTAAREFLRNYQSDARLTARGILFVLSHEVNKNVAVGRVGDRWVAAVPKGSASLWRLNPGMSFSGARGQVWSSGSEAFVNASWAGYYVQVPKSSDGPCDGAKNGCDITTRSFAEVPPVPTWTKIRAKTHLNFKDQTKIFVSGYEARQVSDSVVEYWGQDRARVNVTVVSAGRVVHRAQILNDSKTLPTIAVGAGAMSRR